MKPSLTQKLLSYVSDVPLEHTGSDYSEELHVVLSRGRMQLLTENAIYSYGDLYSNYERAFKALRLERFDIKNMLILGFGLGSIPFMLENRFKKNYHYTGVEIDETVIYLADKYVTQYLKSPIEMIQADAFGYTIQCQQEFDVVCVDLFIDDEVPSKFESEDFLFYLKKVLGDKGILMYNRLYLTKKDKKATVHSYNNIFLKIFPKGGYLDVTGNWILTNKPALFS